MTWPATSQVAHAYVDQLVRVRGIAPEQATVVRAALDRVDELRTGKEAGAAAVLSQIDELVTQLKREANAALGRDPVRLRALSETLAGRVARLR